MKQIIHKTCILILFLSSITFASSIASKEFIRNDISAFALSQLNIEKQIDEVLNPIREFIPKETLPIFDSVTKSIKNSEELHDMIKDHTQTFMDGLFSKQNQESFTDINKKAKEFVESKSILLKEALGPAYSDHEKDELIEQAISHIDVAPYFKDATQKVKTMMPDSFLPVLRCISILSQTTTTILSFILMVLASIGLIMVKTKNHTWKKAIGIPLILSGSTLIILGFLFPVIFTFNSSYNVSFSSFTILWQFGLGFILLGSVLCFIQHKSNNK